MAIRSTVLVQVLSLAALLALWQFAAVLADSRVLPPPLQVLEVMIAGFEDGEGFEDVKTWISSLEAELAEAKAAYELGQKAEQEGDLKAAIEAYDDAPSALASF